MYSIPKAMMYEAAESSHQNHHRAYMNELPPQPHC